jgi:cysteinyl-tRNA synthetase
MEWDSPWGRGFPGWHIECSAMAMKYLGESFDIHCGGVDHIPIHHTNEIAQAEGATGEPFVRTWIHGEFLLMNNAKMAKSSGGFLRLQDLADKGFDPLDFRYLCLTAHYRKQLDFTWESLDAAKTARLRLREKAVECLRSKKPGGRTKENQGAAVGHAAQEVQEWLKAFQADIANDLNMPGALSTLHKAMASPGMIASENQLAFLIETDKVLGLRLTDPFVEDKLPPEIEDLLKQREEARRRKDFAGSDALRKALAKKGILVEDTAQGQRWKKKP